MVRRWRPLLAALLVAVVGAGTERADNATGCVWTARPPAVTCHWRHVAGEDAVVPEEGHRLAGQVSSVTVSCSRRHFFHSQLGAGAFAGLEGVRHLKVLHCKLDELAREPLAPLSDLRELTVRTGNSDWGSRQLRVPPRALAGLRQLRKLDLSFNGMQKLEVDSLCGAPNLHRVILAHNSLEVCQIGLSGCPSKVHHLDLSHNQLGDIPSGCLSGLRHLRSLRLSHNRIRALGAAAFEALPQLRAAMIESNQVRHVAETAFSQNTELRRLELQDNEIERLGATTLRSLRHLTLLNMSHNALGTDNGSVSLRGALRLTVLDLSHNSLPELPELDGLFSLQALNLSNNRISSVSGEQLEQLVNLGTLDLSANWVQRLPTLALRGLAQLTLAQNQIQTVAPAALVGCAALRSLDLTDNLLQTMPSTVYQLRYLEELKIAGNRLERIIPRYEARGRGGLTRLLTLDLSRNNITTIQSTDLLPMWNVRWLDLGDNNISSVAVGTFQKLGAISMLRLAGNHIREVGQLFMAMKTLHHLDLSRNQITYFDLGMIPRTLRYLDLGFNNLPTLNNTFNVENIIELEVLNLTNNAINELAAGVVPARLERLILSHNNISKIASDVFNNRTGLKLVDLSWNKLRALNDFPFKNRSLKLGGNPLMCDCTMEWLLTGSTNIIDRHQITCEVADSRWRGPRSLAAMSRSMFLCQYETHCFALCFCCEFDACDCEMACPEGCSCFNDHLWSVNRVDCSHQNHSQIPQPMPMDATDVFLDGNAIASLGNHVLIGRKFMQRLYLNNSDIDAVDNKTFNGLTGLQELHLQHNRIHTLVGYEFEDLSSLRLLYLHHNQIAWLNASVFQPLQQLQELTLHHNQLTELDHWPFLSNQALSLLTLSENPWSCGCSHLRQLGDWLRAAADRVPDATAVTCYDPVVSAVGPPLLEGPQEDCRRLPTAVLSQRRDVYVSLSLFAVLSASALLLLAACVFLFRRQIRYLLFTELNVRLGEADDGEGSMFDVFVSHGSKDTQLASQLVAELETGHPPYRCCVLHRDVPPQPAAIRRAAAASRRVLLVVTQNFLDNEWCHFAFKSAHTEAAVSGRRRLVVVCDGGLPDADTDQEMTLLLRTHPVVRWGEKRFWQALRYRLPRPRGAPPAEPWWRRWRLSRAGADSSLTRSVSSSVLCEPVEGVETLDHPEKGSAAETSALVPAKTPVSSQVPSLYVEKYDNSRVYYTIDFHERSSGDESVPPAARHATLHTYQNSDGGGSPRAFDASPRQCLSGGGGPLVWLDRPDDGRVPEAVYDDVAGEGARPEPDAPGYVPASWVFYSVRRPSGSRRNRHSGQTYLV
ncbi:toll-like receptor 7 [Amphibalanus amphitrite]|uniref:toll-like receptor 7 n=1 Tax=Amphibalanus amphitrite TaxID=1232801 RepID=UPI001C911B69|nr:toll-like receptor 7 [Amphibalanus amphitrite]